MRAIFGAKDYSVLDTGTQICLKLGLDAKEFTPLYNEAGIHSSGANGIRILVVRNRVNAAPNTRYPKWEETKFYVYPVLIHLFVDSDKYEFPPARWQDIEKTILSFEGIKCLYLQDY